MKKLVEHSTKWLKYVFLTCVLIFPLLGFTQKPKLGLVLSGGGAKGIAHIGVLKSMERAGLRPDYITGTSMGSIIGGLYAIGYTADEIEAIVTSIDWDLVLSNNIPLNYISYEEKEYYNRFLIELPIENRKVLLPTGLIEGQMLSEALNRFTWPSMTYDDFDDFPIPFRCIGTDVSNGKQIIFRDGSLAEAMRASMAIPTAFTAADLDSTLAVDGGVVNNFPADVLKEMGADIIIGVNVTRGFKPAEEVNSMAGILMQMSMLSSNEKLPRQEALCDIYIQPDLDDYSTASFSKYNEILEIGHNAGAARQISFDSIAQITGKKELPQGVQHQPDFKIDSIELSGNKLFNDVLVRSKLGFSQGDTLSVEQVEEGVRTVYGINGFHKVEYRMRKQDDGGMNFKLKMSEKHPGTMRAAFHYDNTFSAGVVVNIQARDLLLKSSRTIVAMDISENPQFRFDYYKYSGKRQRVAFNFRYNFFREQLPIYDKGVKTDLQVNTEQIFSANILTTHSLKNSYFIGGGYELNRFSFEFSGLFPDGLDYGDFNFGNVHAGFIRNSLNNRNYPTKGTERFIMGEAVINSQYNAKFNADQDSLFFIFPRDSNAPVYFSESEVNEYLKSVTPSVYGRFYFRSIDYIPLSKKFQIIPYLSAGLIISADSANYLFNEHYVGGLQQVKITDTKMFGYNYGEQQLENFAIGGLHFQNVILRNFFLEYGADLLMYYSHIPLDQPEVFELKKLLDEQTVLGYGAELTYKSFIGPISLGISTNADDGYVRYHFSVGFSFKYTD